MPPGSVDNTRLPLLLPLLDSAVDGLPVFSRAVLLEVPFFELALILSFAECRSDLVYVPRFNDTRLRMRTF